MCALCLVFALLEGGHAVRAMSAGSLPSGANAKGALVATTEPRSLAVREKQALASQRSLFQQFGERDFPRLLPYSSTEIRQRIAAGQDASHMLHPDVAQYIRQKQHYAPKN